MTSEIPQGYFSEFVTNFPNFILVWHNTIGINFAILDIASDSGTVQLEIEACVEVRCNSLTAKRMVSGLVLKYLNGEGLSYGEVAKLPCTAQARFV